MSSDAIRKAADEIDGLLAQRLNHISYLTESPARQEIAAILSRWFGKGETEQPSCWHCGVVLADAPKLRCEDCPDECDVEGCDEIGCAAAPASASPAEPLDTGAQIEFCERCVHELIRIEGSVYCIERRIEYQQCKCDHAAALRTSVGEESK